MVGFHAWYADWPTIPVVNLNMYVCISMPCSPFAFVIMNHHTSLLRKLAGTGLGLAFSLFVLITAPVFSSPAQALGPACLSPASMPLATAAGGIKAGAKDVEGKTQESIGEVTGNQGDRLAGKAKQSEAKVHNPVEDVKDKAVRG
ncbi:MAG: CsbD family protein [Synechococcaceae cyanobacterium]